MIGGGWRLSTAKAPRCAQLAFVFRPERGGQARAGRLHDLRLPLQSLLRLAPDRPGDADRADDAAGEVLRRNRNAAYLQIELALIEGDAGASNLRDLAQQRRNFGDRVVGRGLELHPLQEPLEL